MVRIEDRVVVGVDQEVPVLGRDGHVVVGQEPGEFAGIALVVAEVRPVAVEDEEDLPGFGTVDDLAHFIEELHVLPRGSDIDHVAGIVSEVVDTRPFPEPAYML